MVRFFAQEYKNTILYTIFKYGEPLAYVGDLCEPQKKGGTRRGYRP